jgi:hypothetical protein
LKRVRQKSEFVSLNNVRYNDLGLFSQRLYDKKIKSNESVMFLSCSE